MSTQRNVFSCCGIAELADIRNDASPERSILNVDYPDSQGVIIFSDTNGHRYKYGTALARYIRKHKLGSVTGKAPTINPNTRNRVRVWMWSPTRTTLKKHQRELRKKFPKPATPQPWWM